MYPFRDFIISEAAQKPHYLVVGHPISHSLSPLMHRIALQYHRMDAGYYAVDLEQKDLSSFIAWINRDAFLGANITIPYKQEMIRVVDRPDVTVESIGALNTIVKRDKEILGFNTDVAGFRFPLRQHEDLLAGEQAIIFGTGGASRAVRFGLRQLGVRRLVMVSRNPGQQITPVPSDDSLVVCSYQNWNAYADEAALIINTTPLGMAPERQRSPVREEEIKYLEGKICYDLVYNPVRTTFIKQAEKAGARCITGMDMFIHQGNESFRLWTGKSFPVKQIRKKLETVFKEA